MSDEQTRLLYEILQYVRAQAISSVRATAPSVLDSAAKRQVYNLMDGKRTQREIVDLTKMPQPTVSRYMTTFLKAGLAVPSSSYFPGAKALFTLDELGIDPGPGKKTANGAETSEAAPTEARA